MKPKLFLLFVLICANSWLQSTIWHIKQDGTGNFTTIQAGINASADSDTVLVYPNTYYENINYYGKNITVASLEIITGDEQYITHTIIDGQRYMSVVKLSNEESDACLQGLTITNGQGEEELPYVGGGISIHGDNDLLVNIDIINCVITNNFGFGGAGICCYNGNLILSGSTIRNNFATLSSGGILIGGYSEVTFDPSNRCNLYNNYAATGLDIVIMDEYVQPVNVIVDTFTVQNPTRYFAQYYYEDPTYTFDILNYALEPVNHDLYVASDGDDNNTGLTPFESMKTINLAMRKIVSDSLNPKTIHLAPGTYGRNQQLFALGVKSHVRLEGDGMRSTFIDGENEYGKLLFLAFHYEDIEISNLSFLNALSKDGAIYLSKISNIKFENINIFDNYSFDKAIFHTMTDCDYLILENVNFFDNESMGWACAATVYDAINPVFRNCSFINNSIVSSTAFKAGLGLNFEGDTLIENCIFKDNYCENPASNSGSVALTVLPRDDEQGDIYIRNLVIANNTAVNTRAIFGIGAEPPSRTYLSNCTIVDNASLYACSMYNLIDLNNTIIRNDCTYEIILWDNTAYGYIDELTVNNCNILGGENSIYNQNGVNFVNWEEGNIDEDPLFLNWGEYPYQLTELSPCIDAGTPDTTGIFIPPWDLLNNHRVWDGDENGTAVIDMGCYEYGAEPFAGISNNQLPMPSFQLSNYPNPFNPSTTIAFNLSESGKVKVEIFNIKGQKVKTLMDCTTSPGKYELIWNGKNCSGKSVASGEYIALLKFNGEEMSVRKIMLMK